MTIHPSNSEFIQHLEILFPTNIHIWNTHFPHKKEDIDIALKDLSSLKRKFPDSKKIIILGDLNSYPDTHLDTYKPGKIIPKKSKEKLFKKIKGELIDPFRQLNPKNLAFTHTYGKGEALLLSPDILPPLSHKDHNPIPKDPKKWPPSLRK